MDTNQLADRMAKLESRSRRARMLLGIVFVALLAETAWIATRGGNIARHTIECQHMVVTDDQGRRRLELGMQSIYGAECVPAIRIFDEAGMSRVELSAAYGSDGPARSSRPTLALRYADGAYGARLSLPESKVGAGGSLCIWGKDDAQATLSAGGQGESSLTLQPGGEYDSRPTCDLSVDSYAGSLRFVDDSPCNALATLMAAWKNGAVISLENAKGETTWESP